MKKYYLYCFCFIIILFSVQNVFAIGIGHTGDNVVFFRPNIEKSFYFTLRNVGGGTRAELYATGDLADYVTLSDLSMEKIFIATVRLPEEIERPGIHIININAKEVPINPEGTIAAVTAVAVPIKIIVPYPGKYIEATLDAPDINVGDTADFAISITNLGEENITSLKGYVYIYGPDNEEVATLETKEKSLQVNTLEKLHAKWQTTDDQKEGAYTADVTVVYDGATLKIEKKGFRIGKLLIKIVKVTEKFEKDKVNPFVIEIKSEWANKISDVYADVKITGNGVQIDSFETPRIEINPFERKEITAYWNTKGIDAGSYNAIITLHYADKKIEKVVEIQVEEAKKLKEKKFPFLTVLYVAIIILIVIIYYINKKKKIKL